MEIIFWLTLQALLIVAMFFCGIMLRRNREVAAFRRRVLNISSYNYSRRNFTPYDNMPDYGHMMREWWVPTQRYLDEAIELEKRLSATEAELIAQQEKSKK